MQCRMCGFEFDERRHKKGCQGCGKCNCSSVHCPNCGYANHPEFEEEFNFIKTLKEKIKLESK